MTTIYVGGLPRDARTRDLDDFFRGFGPIRDISLKAGFAFVEFDDDREADAAVRRLDGTRLLDARVAVEISKGGRRKDDSRGGGRDDRRDDRGGGYGGGRDFGRGGGGGGYNNGGGRGGGGRDSRDRFPRRERPERTKFSLIIKNLSTRVNWMDLKDMARKYGHVTFTDANKIRDREGVVTFSNSDDMRKAYDGMQGKDLQGREMEVDYEFPEVLDPDWRGDVNNDHPPSFNAKDNYRSRSRESERSRSPRERSRSPRRRSRSRS